MSSSNKAPALARKEKMKMFRINNQKNHARQLLGLTLAAAMLISIFAVTGDSQIRPRSSGIARTDGATESLRTSLRPSRSGAESRSFSSGQVSPQTVNRWSSNGPEGDFVFPFTYSLAIDRSNASIVYAGTGAGVLKTTDGGDSWRAANSGLTDLTTYALEIDPGNPNIIFAATAGGAFKSANAGGSWTTSDFYPLAFDPTNPSIIYANVAGHNGLSRSTDGGLSWNAINTGLEHQSVSKLTIDPSNPNIIYAATAAEVPNGNQVFKSTDAGAIWARFSTGLELLQTGPFINALVVDPLSPSTIYAGGAILGTSFVFKSTDSAMNWAPFFIPGVVNQLAIESGIPNVIFAGTSSGVFKSSDRANSWTTINSGITDLNVQSLVIDPLNTAVLYAGTAVGGIFKSTSGGASWSAVNNGLVGHRLSINVGPLAVDPRDSNTIYAGSPGSGIYKSSNKGGSWIRINNGPFDQLSSLAIDPLNSATVYAGTYDSGVYKSTNGGASWSPSGTGLVFPYIYTLAIDPRDPNVIYAVTGFGVFKSTNGGGSWSALSDDFYPSSLVIDPSNSQTLYAVSYYDCDDYGCNSTVFKSTDAGITWTRSDTGTNFYYVAALAIDPINTATIYVSAYASDTHADGGIYKSTDSGGTWSFLGAGLPNSVSSLVIDPVNPNNLYAAPYGEGVFKSADGGATWNPLNNGLTDLNINSLVIDAAGSSLHVGTASGVFDYQFSTATNQIDDASTFVRQQYLDFLNREPDQNGWDYWTNRITQCGNDARCIHERRIGVSAAFFVEQEFQDTGYYVDRFYKASFWPSAKLRRVHFRPRQSDRWLKSGSEQTGFR